MKLVVVLSGDGLDGYSGEFPSSLLTFCSKDDANVVFCQSCCFTWGREETPKPTTARGKSSQRKPFSDNPHRFTDAHSFTKDIYLPTLH